MNAQMFRSTLTLALVAVGATAAAQPVESSLALDGTDLIVREGGRESRVALGCAGGAVVRQGARAYVACGLAGVVEVDLTAPTSPRRVALRDAGGDAVGFFVADGAVWTRITRTEARPVEGLAVRADASAAQVAGPVAGPVAAPVAAPVGAPVGRTPSAGAEERRGRVVSVGLGEVVVDLGSSDGLSVGARLELFREQWTRLDEGDRALRLDSIAIGEVTVLSTRRARVRLGTGERVTVGVLARPTEAPATQSTIAPPRVGGIWEIHGALRPFLSLERLAMGGLAHAEVVYRGSGPWSVRAGAVPLAFAFGQDAVINYGLMLTASYDSRLFELGLGLGVASNTNNYDGARDTLALGQRVRLGAIDGLHLVVQNAFLLGNTSFLYGGTSATVQIPAAATLALIFRGGGGITGYGFGEAGLRIRVRGNGDHGSLFLTPSVGGVVVQGPRRECPAPFDGTCYGGSTSHGGPLVGLGVEYRP